MNEEINKRAMQNEVNKQLSNTVSNDKLEFIVKQHVGQIDQQTIKRMMEKVYEMEEQKVSKSVFERSVQRMAEDIKQMMDENHKKLEMDQICTILDNKANIEDINRVFQEFHSELLKKISVNDFKSYKTKQMNINESLCIENILGRWTWKGSQLGKGFTILWENQTVNTLPDNFIYEKGKQFIQVVNAGLYKVEFGFYSKKKPTVQM